MQVKAWKETVVIPTYKSGAPDKNPMFLEKRVYQGSSGVVYPHPVIDKVFDEKEDKEWIALYIENDYIKVMILPELGGRIQMAYDKTNDYHFVYHNSVIKPALVGLAGPWISGGIEFNWPQHHRPSTYGPIDYTIEENADGSKTIRVNEYEVMFRTRCSLGFTLYPDKAFIELHAKLYNRTPFPQTFLWWANPAVAVDEHYQSVFPPDVHAVYDHGKRDVSSFPIATGTYYKVDYSPGTDISIYNNIPVPTSYMAVNSAYNFVGGYHLQRRAGLMHVADHHISPGKKQWTWGSGEFGKAWDKHLTDSDGPYFELMCGVYTDNQPDFSWIMPNEVREFHQYFMPYKEIGNVKNASTDVMINFEIGQGKADIGVYVTSERNITIEVKAGEILLYTRAVKINPHAAFLDTIALDEPLLDSAAYTIFVNDENGFPLLSYTPEIPKEKVLPDPAKPIAAPEEIDTVESLYLAGLHLEQYRHATYRPEDYYREALKRDPSDSRTNNAMGVLCMRTGAFEESTQYFLRAMEKLNRHNPNPYDSEPLYNMGIALCYQRKYDEAFPYLFKSTWTTAFQDKAYFEIAAIEAFRHNWPSALQLVNRSLNRNQNSQQGKHLKAIILRNAGNLQMALEYSTLSIGEDPFDFGNYFEKYLVHRLLDRSAEAMATINALKELTGGREHTYIEIAIDYARAGQFAEAYELLSVAFADGVSGAMILYYLGYYALQMNNRENALTWWTLAFNYPPDRVFPNRLEDVEVLNTALLHSPMDHKAHYYLGNFFYAKRRYMHARHHWEESNRLNDRFPTVLRNLGIAYFNKFDKKAEALQLFEKALQYGPDDARILFELDQLHKLMLSSPGDRLARLDNYQQLVTERDDLYLEYITLYNITGQPAKALELLASRKFHPWEGGEGKVSGQHISIHVQLALEAISAGEYEKAVRLLDAAQHYPDALGEGKLFGAQENDIHYWQGYAYDQLGQDQLALACWSKAAVGLKEPGQAIFYNDQQPDKIFYQGLALQKLGRMEEADQRFAILISYGETHQADTVKMDFFAVSHPDLTIFDDDLTRHNAVHCYYLQGLGWLGRKQFEKAAGFFTEGLRLNPSHAGILLHESLRVRLNG
jgi:tetratricopeptide (TPR) repeat protein